MLVVGGCEAIDREMDRRKVDGLIALVASDASLSGMLSDYLMECGQWVHPYKRHRINVLDLCEVAHLGTAQAKSVGRRVKGAVVLCGKYVACRRRLRVFDPECAERSSRHAPVVATLREAEGDQHYRARLAGWRAAYALHVLRGKAHCVRLAQRGIEGRDVPGDVAEAAGAYRAMLVQAWRDLAPWMFQS